MQQFCDLLRPPGIQALPLPVTSIIIIYPITGSGTTKEGWGVMDGAATSSNSN